jgi:hypothetical protein
MNLRYRWKLLPGEFEEFEIEEQACSSPEMLRHQKEIYSRTSSCVEKGDAAAVTSVTVAAAVVAASAAAVAAAVAAAAAAAAATVAAAGVVEAAEEVL